MKFMISFLKIDTRSLENEIKFLKKFLKITKYMGIFYLIFLIESPYLSSVGEGSRCGRVRYSADQIYIHRRFLG